MEKLSQTPSLPADGAPRSAETLDAAAFDLLLEHEQRVLEGAPDLFEALCEAHPALAAALRRLRAGPTAPPRRVAREDAARAPSSTSAAPNGAGELLALAGADSARAARYERRSELGRGAMGAVYEVWDRELARSLAMKVLASHPALREPPAASAQRLQRFLREVRTAAQLDHPGIVPVHDFGLDAEGRPFFTMKRVQGRELKAVFTDVWSGEGEWTLARAVGALLKVCEAVEYAHSKGVVHRDLKPANVMIGPFGEVFVMDWGVAHLFGTNEVRARDAGGAPREENERSAELTDDGDVLGTASYMAPEQAQGKLDAIGPSIDIYAVGAMLYHLLARRAPYVMPELANTTAAVLGRLLSGPPLALANAAPAAPAELISIAEKAMARDVGQRYSQMGALASDLRAWLEGRVVAAHEVGSWAQLRKWVARNKGLSLSSAAAALALLAGLAAVTRMQTLRARDAVAANGLIRVERDNAKAAAERARVEALTAERTVQAFDTLFQGVTPGPEGGGQVTVAAVLELAARRVSAELAEEPAARSRVVGAIGSAFGGLGFMARASELLTQSHADARAAFGDQSPRVLDLELRLAALAVAAGDLARAAQRLELLSPRISSSFDGAMRARHAQCEAIVAMVAGRHAEALERIAQAADCAPLESPLALELDAQLCDWMIALGQLEPARARALSRLERSGGFEAWRGRADAFVQLAKIDRLRGELELSREHYRSAEQLLRSGDWLDEPALARVLHEQAWLAARAAEVEEAERCFREAVAAWERSLGPTHPATLVERTELADFLRARELPEEGLALAQAVLEGWARSGSAYNDRWSAALRVVAQCAIDLGRWETAEAAASERFERGSQNNREATRALLEEVRARRPPR